MPDTSNNHKGQVDRGAQFFPKLKRPPGRHNKIHEQGNVELFVRMNDGHAPQAQTNSRMITPISEAPSYITSVEAKTYRQVLTVLVPFLLALNFSALVTDPVSTLAWGLLPLAILQVIYCVICLPHSSGNLSAKPPKKDANGARKPPKRVRFPAKVSAKITTALLSLIFCLLITLAISVLIVLFGASITDKHSETLLLAAHMALLTCPPLFYVHGTNTRMWREIITLYLPFDEMFGAVVGCFLCTWASAPANTLDWDRVWQRWPVPQVVGAYVGWAGGRVVGETLLKGWRIPMEELGEERKE